MQVDPRAFKKRVFPKTKICPRCNVEKDYQKGFYLKRFRGHDRDSLCKACKADAYKIWSKTPEGKAAHLAAQRKYLATPAGKAAQERARQKRAAKAKARKEAKASKNTVKKT